MAIQTSTLVKRISVAGTQDLDSRIKNECDKLGAADYRLSAMTFVDVDGGVLLLVFQMA